MASAVLCAGTCSLTQFSYTLFPPQIILLTLSRFLNSYCMFLVIKDDSCLQKFSFRKGWNPDPSSLVIFNLRDSSSSLRDSLSILCGFFSIIFLSYITHLVHSQPPSWASQEHSGLVNHLQSTFTGSQSEEKKMCFLTWSHLAEAKHFQGSLADTQAPSKAHSKEQAILLLPFMMLPVNSLVSAPSSHAGFQHLNFLPGWEGKGAFPKALPAMPRVNSPLYQEPLLVLLALRMHNFMTWVKTQQQWILNKDNWGFYFFPGKLKGLVHI